MRVAGCFVIACLMSGCSQAWWEEWAKHDTPIEACQRAYRQDLMTHCDRAGREADIACVRLMQADRDRCLALALPPGSPPLPPVPAVGPIEGEDLVASIPFAIDEARIDPAARIHITLAAARALRDTDHTIEVRGHADFQGEGRAGGEEHNVELSHARALAVRDALIASGVPAERISAGGYGALEPRGPASTEEGRARSRVAEIVLLPARRING